MLALYLSPLYFLANTYLLFRLLHHLGALSLMMARTPARAALSALYIAVALSMLPGLLLPAGTLRRLCKLVSNYWLGVLLYLLLIVSAVDIVCLLLRWSGLVSAAALVQPHIQRRIAAGCLALVTAVSVYGGVNARIIRTTPYQVTIRKSCPGRTRLRIGLVADLHLGYNIGCLQMEQMVKKLNAQHPDLVVIAGDIFDNEYDALEDAGRLAEILRGIEAPYGVYACGGNHDIAEKILAGFTFGRAEGKASDPRMDTFLQEAGIRMLWDEGVVIDDWFTLYGRPDAERPGRGQTTRRSPAELMQGIDTAKPVILLDHQPRQLAELADAGVDLDLSGHTHDGQLFPANLLTALLWENPCGLLQKGRMTSIVTGGVGLFGPNMRVATRSEICILTVDFRGD